MAAPPLPTSLVTITITSHTALILLFFFSIQSLKLVPVLTAMTPPSTPRTADNRPPPALLSVLFENDRVKVSDVRLKHRGDAILFSSQYPTVRWQVDDGVCIERRRRRRTRRLSRQQQQQQQPQQLPIEIKTASGENGEITDEDGDEAGKESKIIKIPDKTVFFENGGNGDACSNNNGKDPEEIRTESIQETTSLDQQRREKVVVDDDVEIEIENCCDEEDDSEFRQIWFEIKQSRPRRTEEETRTLLDNAIYSTDVGTTLLFENKYCRVWDFYYEPGGGDPSVAHHHVLDYVFVYVAKGRLLGYSHSGRPGLFDSINDDGDVSWFDIPDGAGRDPNYAHGGKNGYEDLPMREYLVELK